MSFIDKALERAKSLRQKGKDPAIPLEKEAISPSPSFTSSFQIMDRGMAPTPAEDINYSITRSVPVNMETVHRNRLILGEENIDIIEEYKRTRILQSTKGEQRNVLMVTGPLPGEGKTLTSINLAISIAQEVEKAALLVDADLRSPSVHRYFGVRGEPGLKSWGVKKEPAKVPQMRPKGPRDVPVMKRPGS